MINCLKFEKITLDWKCCRNDESIPRESGIYQIYGDSPVYGLNVLLYIGKANDLYNRIAGGHNANPESFITRQPNISYRFATIADPYTAIAEEILIVMHKPAFNSRSIIQVSNEAKKGLYYIQNHGERGMLNLEVTNYYFLSHGISASNHNTNKEAYHL